MQGAVIKDPAIKLFGKNISLPPHFVDSPSISSAQNYLSSTHTQNGEEEQIIEKECSAENTDESTEEVDALIADCEDPADKDTVADSDINPQTPSINEESAKSKPLKSGQEQNDATISQEKAPLKKPDKIIPCPRCNSMDTKFCYFNNYNANQPRHLCKTCQRYWTAGGTMRNVPVGAGRRKNKNSASHYRHITISEALQAACVDAANGAQHPALKNNGRVLSFGINAPIYNSMASVVSLVDNKVLNGTRNGFHTLDEQRFVVPCKGEKSDECSSGSSVTVSNSMEGGGKPCSQETMMPCVNGFASQIPSLSRLQWPYPWNSTLPSLAPPAFCPPGFPLSFHPSAYWGSVAGTWNNSLPPPRSSSSSENQKSAFYSLASPTLGKHSRDQETTKPTDLEKEEPPKKRNGCVVIPKTLRTDDPSEAAKSSIWATLGIKNETSNGRSFFKAFQPKTDEKNHQIRTSPVLQANPAALSRSINFHEKS